jgi:pyrroline-5-carboxylate reductase
MMTQNTLLLIGCGKMGTALASSWLAADDLMHRLWIADPAPLATVLTKDSRVAPWAGQGAPAVVVLAVKPQLFPDVLPLYRAQLVHRPVIVSIAAGVTLAQIAAGLGGESGKPYDGPVVRAMPNTPAAVGQGITALVANAATDAAARQRVTQLLAASGQVVWLKDEADMHAVTAISGSGPAYVFAFIEALTAAGEALGLPPTLAAQLVHATVTGSAALAAHSPDSSPATLRQAVTSPGGTTAAGLQVLQAELPGVMVRTAAAALRRSRELAGECENID